MAKKRKITRSRIDYMTRCLVDVEQARSQPPSADELARILAELQSPDEQVRAAAVRQVCPCRLPWDIFQQLRKAAKRLQQDPSPLVRRHALHVEEDARMIASLEALQEHLEAEADEASGERCRRKH